MNRLAPMKLSHNDLPDVNVVGALDDTDMACLEEVRAVLEKHGRAERFGIALLHRHFELAPDEVLVEECDVATRTLTTRPAKLAELDFDDLLTTIWVADGSSAQACKQFCPKNEGRHQGWKDHDPGD